MLSLVFWSLTMVVTVKYLTFIMQADNRGEGGILALLALVPSSRKATSARIGWIAGLVIFGAALLYGDGVITPAISVLSAVEGLEVATPSLNRVVVPLTVVILFGLFWVQRRGTASIGARLRAHHDRVVRDASRCSARCRSRSIRRSSAALNPVHAVAFFVVHGCTGFLVLGAWSWSSPAARRSTPTWAISARAPSAGLVSCWSCPRCVINYFGQAAVPRQHPERCENPFFAHGARRCSSTRWSSLVDRRDDHRVAGAHLRRLLADPSGRAARLLSARHHPAHLARDRGADLHARGQRGARDRLHRARRSRSSESGALAAAYGIAVTGTMAITSRRVLRRPHAHVEVAALGAVPLSSVFLTFDMPFFAANASSSSTAGGSRWPSAAALFLVMTTWKTGRALLGAQPREQAPAHRRVLGGRRRAQAAPRARDGRVHVVQPAGVPIVLLAPLEAQPGAARDDRPALGDHRDGAGDPDGRSTAGQGSRRGFFQVTAHYGFMQTPNVPQIMGIVATHYGVPYVPERTSYFLGRETLLRRGQQDVPLAKGALLVHLAQRPLRHAVLRDPPDRVVELGMQIDL